MFNLFKKKEYMNWKDYSEKINFLANFSWQQDVRRQNIKR
jgi:hypothetical protein